MAQLATMAAQQQMLNNRLAALGKGQLGGKGKDKKGKGKGTGKPYWECAVCGCTTNFATNTACYQCWMPKGTPPPPQHPPPPQPQAGGTGPKAAKRPEVTAPPGLEGQNGKAGSQEEELVPDKAKETLEEEKAAKVVKLQEALASAKTELEYAKNYPGDKREQLVTEAQEKVNKVQAQLLAERPLGQQLKSYQDKVDAQQKTVDSLEESISNKKEELEQLETQLSTAKKVLVQLETERQSLLNKAVTPSDVLDVLDTDALLKELKERASTEELQSWLEALRLQHAAGTVGKQQPSAGGALGSQAPYGWLAAQAPAQETIAAQAVQGAVQPLGVQLPEDDAHMEPSKKRAAPGDTTPEKEGEEKGTGP